MIRKIFCSLLCAVLLVSAAAAYAQPFVMAGFDDASANHDWETNLFFRRMEEKTGVTFIYLQYSDKAAWTQAKASLFAEGEQPDVLFKAELTSEETERLFGQGYLIDLAPYVTPEVMPNLCALLEKNPAWRQAITGRGGEIITLPYINELPNNNTMWINRRWLDTLKLSVPATAEELTEVLRAFRDGDPNKNGSKDEVPLSFMSMWDLKYLSHAFGIIANDYNVYADEDGTVRCAFDQPAYRDFVNWLHQLWEEGLLYRSGFSSIDQTRMVTDQNAVMTMGMMFAPTPLSLIPATAMDDYDALPPLVCEGKQVYRDFCGEVVRGAFAVTKSCAEPETVLRWVDTLYGEEGSVLAQAGVEGEEFTRASDGTWYWLSDDETVTNVILPERTITSGAFVPMYAPAAFQLQLDRAETTRIMTQLYEQRQYVRLPIPLSHLTSAEQARLDELQNVVAPWAEQQLVHFVTGEAVLDDASWQAFLSRLHTLGMDEIVSIWQQSNR
ncbi:MAG: extracellular solute-binding protein [Clostridia bacterium]|nr:extracellular solute-binding protein [Clostridia bacterium]